MSSFFVIIIIYCILFFPIKVNTCAHVQEYLSSNVPKIIHQQWWPGNSVTGQFRKFQLQTQEIFKDYEYILWNLESIRSLIKDEYPWFLKTYDAYPTDMHRGDVGRYFILYHYGGIYLDIDYVPQVDPYKYLNPYYPTILESPYWMTEQFGTALMASPTKHDFWKTVFETLELHKNLYSPVAATGPILIDVSVSSYKDSQRIHILPCKNFYRFPTGEWNDHTSSFYRISRRIFQHFPIFRNCGRITDDCLYGIHYNTLSWVYN